MKNSKFNSLYQEAYNRYTNGNGFLVGDVVKLKSGYENVESYKSLGENVKQRMKEMLKTGNNIRVGKLHSNSVGSRYSAEGANSAPASMADCYEEYSPGAVRNLITIPVECLEEVDTGANLAPVPEGQKDMEDRVTGPDGFGKHGWHKGKAVNDQNKLGAKQNWVEKGNYELATKNTKLAHSNKYNDILPTKVKGMIKAKNINESQTLLENLYLNILNEDVGTMGGGDAGAQQDANANMEETENMSAGPNVNGKEVDMDSLVLTGYNPNNPAMSVNPYINKATFVNGTPLNARELEELEKFPKAAATVESEVKDESGLQAYIGKKKYGAADFKALQQAGREHNEKKKEQIKHKHSKQAISEDISLKAPKTFLPGGDTKTTEIKASKHSHHGS